MAGGLAPSTPVAAVRSASQPDQEVVRGRLDGLGALALEAPATIVIGAVAGLELEALAPVLPAAELLG